MMQQYLFDNTEEPIGPVNVASVPQRSPFRYPGGKTWFVPRLRQWLSSFDAKPAVFVEPFTGGGISSLTAVAEGLAESAVMIERDEEIAAVWETILNGHANWLAEQILKFEMNLENVKAILARPHRNNRELAFQTILKNRTFHGGILAAGSGFLKRGESGKGVNSRWYPATLASRIMAIDAYKDRIKFVFGDAFEEMGKYKRSKGAVFFIDPPYTAGGKKAGSRLYKHWMIDHMKLFSLCSELRGDFVMTYDNADEVKELARGKKFQAKPIAMKNKHHAELTELVISRDLGWMVDTNRVVEEREEYK